MRPSRSTIEQRRAAKRGETQPVAAVLEAGPRPAAEEVPQLAPALHDATEALLADLKTTLGSLRRRTDADPLSNPIQLLVLAIKEKVDAGGGCPWH